MLTNQFRKEGEGEKNRLILRDFVSGWSIRNNWQLTWQSYKHPCLVCYGHSMRRSVTEDMLYHIGLHYISVEQMILCELCLQCIVGPQLPSFHISNGIFSSCKFPFLQPLISASHSCSICALFLSTGYGYKQRCWRVGIVLLSVLKRDQTLASSALAELQQLLQWLATEPGKWDNWGKWIAAIQNENFQVMKEFVGQLQRVEWYPGPLKQLRVHSSSNWVISKTVRIFQNRK